MRPASPRPLTTSAARRIWLRAQRLDQTEPFGNGAEAVARAVAHLGYVQIDTIHVIERCHHHILWTRIPHYRRTDLHRAQSTDRCVFEYWTHALAYVPATDFRYFLPDMKRFRATPRGSLAKVEPAEVRRVLAMIRKEGGLTIRDFEDEVLIEKEHLWASRKPSKRALQYAFYAGLLTISRRNGMVKTYELTDRHFGWDKRPLPASEAQVTAYVLDRALRSQGVVSLDSACHLDAPRKPALRKLIEARVQRGQLVPVILPGAGNIGHWAAPEVLDEVPDEGDAVHILSPFDPLVIQRRRLRLLFGYEHRFEAYVPPGKRVFGYFALPVLAGEEIVAAIDIKADRSQRRLLIQRWTWVGRGSSAGHKARIEAELDRFAAFQFDPTASTEDAQQEAAAPEPCATDRA